MLLRRCSYKMHWLPQFPPLTDLIDPARNSKWLDRGKAPSQFAHGMLTLKSSSKVRPIKVCLKVEKLFNRCFFGATGVPWSDFPKEARVELRPRCGHEDELVVEQEQEQEEEKEWQRRADVEDEPPTVDVVVPEGCLPGDAITVQLPDNGGQIEVVVPDGLTSGDRFEARLVDDA